MRLMAHRTLAVVGALAVAASTAVAQAPSPHEEAAAKAYAAGDLATALKEFEAAYADAPRPDLLYAIGRLHVARGNCTDAVWYFQRFLATEPGPKATDSATAEIKKCEDTIAAERAAQPPAPESPPAEPEPATTVVEPPPPIADGRSPFYRDLLGNALVGGGVLAGVVGIVLYGQALSAQCGDPVCTGIDYDDFLEQRDRADRLRTNAIIAGGIGGALIIGGVLRYALRDSSPSRRVDVGVAPAGGGGAVVVGGRF